MKKIKKQPPVTSVRSVTPVSQVRYVSLYERHSSYCRTNEKIKNSHPQVQHVQQVQVLKLVTNFTPASFAPRWCSPDGHVRAWLASFTNGECLLLVKRANNKQGCTYYLNLFSGPFSHPTAMLAAIPGRVGTLDKIPSQKTENVGRHLRINLDKVSNSIILDFVWEEDDFS